MLHGVLWITLALTGTGLAVLLLGRAVGLFEIVAGPQDAFKHIGQMLLYLLPHLLGIALPAAFFFGVLLTINRLTRDSEIVVLMASGWGPYQLMRPVLLVTGVLLVVVAIVLGFVTPHARYAYRTVKHTVAQTTLVAAVREGTFIHAGNVTLLADQVRVQDDHIRLSNIFIRHDQGERSSVITARTGWLVQVPGNARPSLLLRDGEATLFDSDGRGAGRVAFGEFRWPLDVPGLESYRRRGLDPRELTLPELWRALVDPPEKPSPAEISAEWNMRLVMIASLPVLPFAAMSLGLGSPRRVRRYSIAIGLVVVIVYFQLIGFGEQMVKRSILPASLALWAPFGVFVMLAAGLFCRTILGLPSRDAPRPLLSGGAGRHSMRSGK